MREPGFIIPFIGFRKLPCNRDGSLFDSGKPCLWDEDAPFYIEVFAGEWLGRGLILWPWAKVRDSKTGRPI